MSGANPILTPRLGTSFDGHFELFSYILLRSGEDLTPVTQNRMSVDQQMRTLMLILSSLSRRAQATYVQAQVRPL